MFSFEYKELLFAGRIGVMLGMYGVFAEVENLQREDQNSSVPVDAVSTMLLHQCKFYNKLMVHYCDFC